MSSWTAPQLSEDTLTAFSDDREDYEYDVFVSYRRHGEWPRWVREIFLPLFHHWLAEELGQTARVFVDQNIAEGDSWPQDLARALSGSRILVPLWTPTYFTSCWCKAELAHVYERETLCGFRTPNRPQGLIVPAALHDGDRFPKAARAITPAQLQLCSSIRMVRNSPTEEELERRIREWVPKVARAIGHAPAFDASWLHLSADSIIGLFEAITATQNELPTLG